MRGRFITLEGGEGAGKTTLAKKLATALEAEGVNVVLTREPGGTPDAETIRGLLVSGGEKRWSPMEEACLLFAARLNHVRQLIEPALNRGDWVICDRFTDSSIAYQGYASEDAGDLDRIRNLADTVMNGFGPELTFIVDVDPEVGLRRTVARGESASRFELHSLKFHERLRQGYLAIRKQNQVRCRLLDGNRRPEVVFHEAARHIHKSFGLLGLSEANTGQEPS